MNHPAVLAFDEDTGRLSNATGRYEKRLEELRGVFHDEDAYAAVLADDPRRLVYEVSEHRADERAGDLIFGTSILHAGTVGAELHLTRGHLHRLADRSEIYHCLRGHGLLVMETVGGDSGVVELTPGVTAYVPGGWIHRSVNVGPAEPFVSLFCYPADAGQDYDVIARAGGMRSLVVARDDGGWQIVSNPRYVGHHG